MDVQPHPVPTNTPSTPPSSQCLMSRHCWHLQHPHSAATASCKASGIYIPASSRASFSLASTGPCRVIHAQTHSRAGGWGWECGAGPGPDGGPSGVPPGTLSTGLPVRHRHGHTERAQRGATGPLPGRGHLARWGLSAGAARPGEHRARGDLANSCKHWKYQGNTRKCFFYSEGGPTPAPHRGRGSPSLWHGPSSGCSAPAPSRAGTGGPPPLTLYYQTRYG